VGWSGGDLTNEPYTIWWGSTKDESTLQSLIEDLRVNHGEVFVVDELADRQLELE
jgi:hypothetical protein